MRGQLIERVTGLLNRVADEIARLNDESASEDEIDADPAE
jgi:hypothetical protein